VLNLLSASSQPAERNAKSPGSPRKRVRGFIARSASLRAAALCATRAASVDALADLQAAGALALLSCALTAGALTLGDGLALTALALRATATARRRTGAGSAALLRLLGLARLLLLLRLYGSGLDVRGLLADELVDDLAVSLLEFGGDLRLAQQVLHVAALLGQDDCDEIGRAHV